LFLLPTARAAAQPLVEINQFWRGRRIAGNEPLSLARLTFKLLTIQVVDFGFVPVPGSFSSCFSGKYTALI